MARGVDVHVHRHRNNGDWYVSEITLVTEKLRRIVQYGIVRLKTSALEPRVSSRSRTRRRRWVES